MTYQEIKSMIESMGFPYAYYQFEEGAAAPTPFVVFYYPERNDFSADNVNYEKIAALTIELYTDEKDFASEAKVESVLEDNEIYYHKEEMYIDSEKMYEISYTMEVTINE